MKQNVNLLYIFLCISLLAVLTVGIYHGENTAEKSGFIVKEYNGCIAVFSEEGEFLKEIPDSNYYSLPKTDKAKLKDGICVSSEDELLSLIEDFSG